MTGSKADSFDELPGALQRIADRRVVGKLVMVP